MIIDLTENEAKNVAAGVGLLEALAHHCAVHPGLCLHGACEAACVGMCLLTFAWAAIPGCPAACASLFPPV